MEPLTTIELGSCGWLGLLALACFAAAELWSLEEGAHERPATFAERERVRRGAQLTRSR